MSIDPVALVRRYHAALQPYDASVAAACFAPAAVYVSPGVNGRIEGRGAIIAAFDAYFAEYPDQQAEDTRIDRLPGLAACAHWRLAATSATTGLRIIRHGVETVRFDAEGLIIAVEVEDL